MKHTDQVYLLEFARRASLKNEKEQNKPCLNDSREESKSVFIL